MNRPRYDINDNYPSTRQQEQRDEARRAACEISEHYTIDTFIGDGLPVEVSFDYQPAEPADPWYPGCPAAAVISAVNARSTADPKHTFDIQDALSPDTIQELEDLCRDSMRD